MSFLSNDPNNTTNHHVVTSYNNMNMNMNVPFPHYPPPPNSSFLFSSSSVAVNGGGQVSAPLICCPKRLTVPARGDRHSKIRTAQGLRDRRVRLSIGIARKFFDLQDLLGFDKASKTLDWLLGQSETAIHELERSKNPVQVQVSLMDQEDQEDQEEENMGGGLHEQQQRRREMARARARERTREKSKIINNKLQVVITSEEDEDQDDQFDHHHFGQIGSSAPKFVTSHEKPNHDLITTTISSKDHDIVISPNSPLLISWDLGTAFSQNPSFLL